MADEKAMDEQRRRRARQVRLFLAARLLAAAGASAQGRPDVTDSWWAQRGAERTEVMSRWEFTSRRDFAAVLRLEFPRGVADSWLAEHPGAVGLSYGYVLFTVRRP